MTPTQRAAAERLADDLQRFDGAERESLRDEAAALLRELLAEPVINQQMTTEPVQEPVAYVDPRQLARGCASLHCITKPKYRSYADAQAGLEYTPVYLHPPQQPMHCPKDGGECGAGGYCRPEPQQRSRALADAGFTRRPSLKAMEMRAALEMIAAPMRPDGTWNRDRDACRELAAEVLGRYDDSKTPNVRANLTKGAADE